VPLGRGRGHMRRLLTALAVYQPGSGRADGTTGALADAGGGDAREGTRPLREIRVRIG